ncbi:MAG: hypothetical protein BZY75_01755 [SAR202 cluster bacterium Io17-Chloro-G7]|nr:MAG: hypothetical protein BZY75_01755 [SAR202 cluster bacterium Io17-Chloro-G7]
MTAKATGQIFIGRQQQMAELTASLDQALSGLGRIVMIAGEPGIGKTRIAQEFASHAESLGAQTFWGWCHEQEGAPPYWPWVQPIRSYIQRTDAKSLAAQMGQGAADLLEVIPELQDQLPGIELPPTLEPQQARFRLFDSIATFLKNVARSQPLVLVLDDLQWADQPSLLLLEFLARQMLDSRIMLVGIYRDVEVTRTHPLSQALARLAGSESFHWQTLEGLDPEDVGELIRELSGIAPGQELIQEIYRHTDGNPFFLTEVIRLLGERWQAAGGPVLDGIGELEIPQSVLEVIAQRINPLSKECAGVLTTAAVIGRQFDFQLLGRLSEDFSETQLLELVDEALDAHIIQEPPVQPDRYMFSHALVQQTLLEGLSTSRKVRLHALVGEALEALYGDRTKDHAAELAHHFSEASPVSRTEKLVRYSKVAGEQALATYAHEEAMEYFGRGLAAKGVFSGGPEPAADEEAAAMLFGFAQAQAATSRYFVDGFTDAVHNLRRAFDYYRHNDRIEQALEVAMCSIRPGAGYQIGLNNLVEPAVKLAPPGSAVLARLLSIFGRVMGFEEGRYDRAEEAFDQALAITEQLGDAALEMSILANAANAQYFHYHLPESLRASLRSIELASHVDDPHSELAAHYMATNCLLSGGKLEDATQQAAAMLPQAERIRDHLWLFIANWKCENTASAGGQWEAARKSSDKSLAIGANAPALCTRVSLEYQSGEFAQGRKFLEQLRERVQDSPDWPIFEYASLALCIPLVARLTAESHWFDEAEAAAKQLTSSPKANPVLRITAQLGLAMMAVINGDKPACQKLYDQLLPDMGKGYFAGIVPDRIMGQLASTAEQPDKAAHHFEFALAFCRIGGFLPELGWTCHDYAESLIQHSNPEHRNGATRTGSKHTPTGHSNAVKTEELLQEAMDIATNLGMPPLMKRIAALQRLAATGAQSAPAYPNRLTQREVEVLLQISQGKTNREIARELVLSERTVQRHIANLYAKIDVRNRAEATVFALSHLAQLTQDSPA